MSHRFRRSRVPQAIRTDGGPFLRLSAIQRSLKDPQSHELDRLDRILSNLERSWQWRSSSGIDLDPYAFMLRAHLQAARAKRSLSNSKSEEVFIRSAHRLTQLLQELSRPTPLTTARAG